MRTLELTKDACDKILHALQEQRLFEVAVHDNEEAAKTQTLINYIESQNGEY